MRFEDARALVGSVTDPLATSMAAYRDRGFGGTPKPRFEGGPKPTPTPGIDGGFGPGDTFDDGGDDPGLQWKELPDGRVVVFDPTTGEVREADVPPAPHRSPFADLIPSIFNSALEDRLAKQFGLNDRGGGSGLGYAQLAESQKNNRFQRALDYISAIMGEQQAGDQQQQNYLEKLLMAGPNLAGGREHFGGFGPYGGGTLLEMMQGGPGSTIDTAPNIMQFPAEAPQPADTSWIEEMLGSLV